MIAGRYELEAEIGRGGGGAVWRGVDQVLGRTVALKRIGVAPGGLSPDALRAEREAKLAAKLSHANVVAVFDLVSENDQQWLVMEHVEGTDLADMVRTRGRLDPDEAAAILAQVAAALAAAHGAGIVHRDVKPSNILVTPSGQVKLSDFGIARTAADPSLTQTGLVTGSPAYLAPEVASGQSATPASDVWSWGATLYHALEGRTPYGAEAQGENNLLGVLYRIVHEQPPRPQAAGWLTPVLEGTMTREVERRWSMARAQEFLAAGPGLSIFPTAPTGGARTRTYDEAEPPAGSTQTLSVDTPVAPPPPPPAVAPIAPSPSRPPRRGRPWLVIVLAALLLVALMVVAFVVGLGGDDDDTAGTEPSAAPSTSAEPSPSESASPSDEPAQPDAADMEAFASDYVATAVADPQAGFALLTPTYQEASGGLSGYQGFWGDVQSADILDISADPAALQVTYEYRYVTSDGPSTERVTLQLELTDGAYLIAGQV